MADLALMHITFRADATFYFYEGELPVRDGVLVIPEENQGLVRRAYALGYQLNPETGEQYTPDAVQHRLETGDWPAAEEVALIPAEADAPVAPEADDDDEDDDPSDAGDQGDDAPADEPEADDAEDDGKDE